MALVTCSAQEMLTVPVTCSVGYLERSKVTAPVIAGSRPGQTIDHTIRPTSRPLNCLQIAGCRYLRPTGCPTSCPPGRPQFAERRCCRTTGCPPSRPLDHTQFAARGGRYSTTGCPTSCLPRFCLSGTRRHHHPASRHSSRRVLSSLQPLLPPGATVQGSERTRRHDTVSCGAFSLPFVRAARGPFPGIAKDTSIDHCGSRNIRVESFWNVRLLGLGVLFSEGSGTLSQGARSRPRWLVLLGGEHLAVDRAGHFPGFLPGKLGRLIERAARQVVAQIRIG